MASTSTWMATRTGDICFLPIADGAGQMSSHHAFHRLRAASCLALSPRCRPSKCLIQLLRARYPSRVSWVCHRCAGVPTCSRCLLSFIQQTRRRIIAVSGAFPSLLNHAISSRQERSPRGYQLTSPAFRPQSRSHHLLLHEVTARPDTACARLCAPPACPPARRARLDISAL